MAVGTPLSIQKQEKKLAKQIDSVYRQAAREIRKKLKDFNDAHKAKNAKMKQMVQDGTLSKEDYKKWLRGQVFQSEQWKRKLDDVVKVYRDADIKAHKIIGGESRNVFVEAANHTAFDIEQDLQGAIAFNLYDGKTVEKLLKDNPKMLPEWKIDEPKDYVWNEKRVQNAVAQGIIQGESIDEIGERLTGELATSNGKKMVLFARTAMTGAQNAGRMQRLRETESMGIEVRKKWLATLDSRTRDAHRDLDGQERKVNENFESDDGEIAYPGDPTAPARLVYNCRCTLTYVYPQYQHLQQNHQRYDQENKEFIQYKTYRQWERWKKGEPEPEVKETPKEKKKMQLKDAQNYDDVRKYFKEEHGITVSESLDKLDFEKVKFGLQGIDDTIKSMPVLKKQIRSIYGGGVGYMCSDGKNIGFNPDYWQKDYKHFYEKYAYQAGAHEVGHCLDMIICENEWKHLEGGIWGNRAYLYGRNDWASNVQAKRIVRQAISNIKKKHPEFKSKSAKDLRWSLSNYALTDTAETLAEAVGNEMLRMQDGNGGYRGPVGHLFGEEIFSIIKKEIEAIEND